MSSEREALENDRAALFALVSLYDNGTLRDALDCYRDGAGAIEPEAVRAWLADMLARTNNTIDALDGAGPPAVPVAVVVLEMDGGIVHGGSSTAPVEVIIRDYDAEGADAWVDCDDDGFGDRFVAVFPEVDVNPAYIDRTKAEIERAENRGKP